MSAIAAAKRRVEDLALLGGTAAFSEPLHVGRPNIGDRGALMRRIEAILDRDILTNHGPVVEEFEARIAAIAGVRHAVSVVNATSGIQVLARALGLTGEVIVPSFTFVGTAHALDWIGLRPIFCDIGPDSPTIDPVMAERLVGPDTSAILGVHLWGHVCRVDELAEVGRRHGIPVIYDAAHAFSGTHEGIPVGAFGTAEVFSFHATKFINSFEGGAVCTDDDDLADLLRGMQNFGFAGYDLSLMSGTNAKMSEVCAAMGLTSIEAMPEIVAANRDNARAYAEGLAGVAGLSVVDPDQTAAPNAQYVVARIDRQRSALSRDDLLRVLRAENVLARRYFFPGCHRMEPYRGRPASAPLALPNTETLGDEVLVLPTGTAIGRAEVEAVCAIIRFSLEHGARIERLLATDGD